MFNHTKGFSKIISFVLCATLLISLVIPAVNAEAIQTQQEYKDILNTNPQNNDSNNQTEIANADSSKQKDEISNSQMTDEQKKAKYQQTLEDDTQNYKGTRFIVKYKDEQSVPQFSSGGLINDNSKNFKSGAAVSNKSSNVTSDKATSAGIQSSEKLAGDDHTEFAVVETNNLMNKDDFTNAMESAGLDSNIDYIQPDYEMTASSDPLLSQEWGLNSTSSQPDDETKTTVGANVSDAWSQSQGDGVIVAVLDSGIDTSHPDINNNIYVNSKEIPGNGIDEDGNGYIDDVSGWDFYNNDNSVNDEETYTDQWHGTHVAGIIAAQKDNGIGVAGVAPNAKILPIKIFEGGVAYTSAIINAIAYAECMGAKIINCSWGSRFNNQALEDAIASSSALFVCATGNNLYDTDNYPVYPAAYSKTHDNVISVAAIDESSKLCRYSNYGPNSVDIAAPGQNILSTWINGEYQSLDGTSMSAAFVSGAAALVFVKNTTGTAAEVKKRLISSADTVTGLENKVSGGKKLNCAYAVSNTADANSNVINIADDETLQTIIPDTEPTENDYKESGAENYVSYKSSMTTARHGLQAVTLNGKIYAIGGQTSAISGFTNVMEVYDPNTDTWSTAASMNFARSYFGAVVYDGKIYVMGGINGSGSYRNDIEVYDPSTNIWTSLSSTMPVAMCAFSATLITGTSTIYVVGGRNSGYFNTVYQYDIASNTWTTKTSLSVPVSDHVAFYYNGKIYIEGGLTTSGSFTYDEYQYTISTGVTSSAVQARSNLADAGGIITNDRFISIGGKTSNTQYSADMTHSALLTENTSDTCWFVTSSHMLTAKAGLSTVLLNGKIYMVGGVNSTGALSSVEMMDLGWQQKATLPAPITNYQSVELDGKIYVMGGTKLVNGTATRSKSVYVYDSATDTWTTRSSEMPVYAECFSLTSAYGKIYVFGGMTTTTSTGTYSASNNIYEYNTETDTWTAKSTLSSARYYSSSVLFNDKIYITGGYNGGGMNTVETYDPLTNTVATKNNLPSTYYSHYSCILNNELYIVNSTQSSALKYDEATDSWISLNPSGSLYANLFVQINGYLYSLGYKNNSTITPDFCKYSPSDNMWTYNLTFNFYGLLQQTVEVNNSAYIFTADSSGYSNGLVEFTPPASAWVHKAQLPRYREGLSAAVINSNVYVAGGYNNTDGYLSTANMYNESTDSWSDCTSMNYARGGLGLAAVNGKLYAIGGRNSSYSALSYVEEYNPTTNVWTAKTAIPAAMTDVSLAVYDNKIYVFGGRDINNCALNTVEIYDQSTNVWSSGATMPTARCACGAALIGTKIYVVGGIGTSGALNTLEVYDPIANTWDTSKASLPQGVAWAGVVASNSLYVIDGRNLTDEISTVYEYSPALDKWLNWAGPNHVRFQFGAAITSKGIYAIGGQNMSSCFSDMEFATISSLNTDYAHMGETTVNMSGNFSRTYTDMSDTAPGFKIDFSRTYNSKDTRTSPISTGWTFGFQGTLASSGNDVIIRLPNGGGSTFQLNSDGSYQALDSRDILIKQSDGSYVLTTKDQYTYSFNSSGYMTYLKDKNGNAISITYNSSNLITQITDQTGRTSTITYSSSKISTITDPAGRIVNYLYDSNGRLSQVTDPNGYSTYYTYDSNGYLSGVKDNNSVDLESVKYKNSKVYQVTDKYGNVTAYTYNESDGLLTATDSNSRTNYTWFDSMLYPIRTKDAEGKETRTIYLQEDGFNKYGEITAYTDRNGNTTYYDRDSNGNVTRQTNPDSSTKEFTYDSNNNVLSERNENGNYKYCVYDTSNNLIKIAQPLNGTDVYSTTATKANFVITAYTYYTGAEALSNFGKTIYGLLKTTTDPEGGVTTNTYDSNGNIATVASPTSKTTTYHYNKLGWLMSVTTPKGNTTINFYDRNGNILKTVNPDTGVTRYIYDSRNNVTQKIMPTQYTVSNDTAATFDSENIQSSTATTYTGTTQGYRFTFTSNGLLSAVTDPCNNTTQYTYDVYGNKLTETKPNGAICTYTYTVMNRISTVTFKETSSSDPVSLQSFDYNILSNGSTTVTSKKYLDDTNTAITKTTYDYAGRTTRIDNADDTYATNTYNVNGTLATSTDANGNTTYYTYDELNRLWKQWSPVDVGTYAFALITYDNANRIKTVTKSKDTVSNGTVPTTNLATTTYTYFADGKVQRQLSSSGAKTVFTYDDDGNLYQKFAYSDASNYNYEEYIYNNIGKLDTKKVYVQNQDITGYDNSLTQLSLISAYKYDLDGNVKTSTDANGVVTTNAYDAMDRLLSTSQPGLDETGKSVTISTSKTYDWAGNVQTYTDALNMQTTYAYDKQENLSTVTDALGGVCLYKYDRAGRKTVMVTPNNYSSKSDVSGMSRTEFKYDILNRELTEKQIYYDSTTSSWKQVVSVAYTYDGNGNVTYKQDALGFQNSYGTTYVYDKANRVTTMTDPACQLASLDHTVLYTYDALGRALTQTDANGVVTAYTYNDDGKVLTVKVGGVLMKANTYDLLGNVLSCEDGNGNTTAYTYNNMNFVRSITLPGDASIGSYTTTYKYTKLGQKAEQLDSLQKQTVATYDNQGHVLTTTDNKSDGTQSITVTSQYDKAGNLCNKTDGNGNTTAYTYDSLNRNTIKTVTVTDINNATTAQTTTDVYDANGNMTSETNWRGNTYSYTYDKLNRLILKADPYGKTIEKLVYNDNSAQTYSTDALNNTKEYVYDRNGRLTQTIDALGHSVYQYYDGAGNIKKKVDGNNNATEYTYDSFNRLVQVKNALNEITSYTYDANGNNLTQTDGKGNITTIKYNCRNLTTERIDAGGLASDGTVDSTKTISYTYNTNGTVATTTDKNGIITSNTYDIHGQKLSVTAGDKTVRYTYDNNGNQLTETDSTGTTKRVYDELGRVISKTVTGIGTSTFLYDVTSGMPSNCTGETTTDPKSNVNTKIYDRAGRLYQIVVGSDTTTYTYFDNGNLQKLSYSNGVTEEYTYYADNSLNTLANKKGSTILEAYNYAYDAAGNMVTKLDIKGTTSYTYDALNRLASITEPSGKVTGYAYDAAGNRQSGTETSGTSVTTTSYIYNAQNRLTSTDVALSSGTDNITNYYYDNSGNTISKALSTVAYTAAGDTESVGVSSMGNSVDSSAVYEYDNFNQLTSISTGTNTLTMAYNGDGLRVEKDATTAGATTTTKFAYEYDKVVLELDGSGNQTAYNVYGNDTLLSRTVGGQTLYYIYNGHGDITGLTDSSGTVVESYYYDAFGNLTGQTGTISNSCTYSGYQYDKETGMYYLNARYYDPVTARFMSSDTYYGQMNNPLSLNLYTYCRNEPLMYRDPTGHFYLDLSGLTASINAFTQSVNNITNFFESSGLTAISKLSDGMDGFDAKCSSILSDCSNAKTQVDTACTAATACITQANKLTSDIKENAYTGGVFSDNWSMNTILGSNFDKEMAAVGAAGVYAQKMASSAGANISEAISYANKTIAICKEAEPSLTSAANAGRTATTAANTFNSDYTAAYFAPQQPQPLTKADKIVMGVFGVAVISVVTWGIADALAAGAAGAGAAGAGAAGAGAAPVIDEITGDISAEGSKVVDEVGNVIKGMGNTVTNSLPANGKFSTVMSSDYAEAIANKGALVGKDEFWVTAADDMSGISSAQDAAERLTLIDSNGALRTNGNAILNFELNGTSGISSPINRINSGFVQGGLTGGGAREWILAGGTQILNTTITYLH